VENYKWKSISGKLGVENYKWKTMEIRSGKLGVEN